MVGIGGAPTRATTLPDDPAERKKHPVASGVLDYFADALVAISNVSWAGNEQHNPGKELHWDRSKSADEADTCIRHFLQRGTLDKDGKRHTAKFAWRALALLQKEIEGEKEDDEALPEHVNRDPLPSVLKTPYEPPAHAITTVDTVLDDHDHANYVPANKMSGAARLCTSTRRLDGDAYICGRVEGHEPPHRQGYASWSDPGLTPDDRYMS